MASWALNLPPGRGAFHFQFLLTVWAIKHYVHTSLLFLGVCCGDTIEAGFRTWPAKTVRDWIFCTTDSSGSGNGVVLVLGSAGPLNPVPRAGLPWGAPPLQRPTLPPVPWKSNRPVPRPNRSRDRRPPRGRRPWTPEPCRCRSGHAVEKVWCSHQDLSESAIVCWRSLWSSETPIARWRRLATRRPRGDPPCGWPLRPAGPRAGSASRFRSRPHARESAPASWRHRVGPPSGGSRNRRSPARPVGQLSTVARFGAVSVPHSCGGRSGFDFPFCWGMVLPEKGWKTTDVSLGFGGVHRWVKVF